MNRDNHLKSIFDKHPERIKKMLDKLESFNINDKYFTPKNN